MGAGMTRRPRLLPALGMTLLFCLGPLLAEAGDRKAEARAAFLAAERALKRGDDDTARTLLPALESYPLLPYLEARMLERMLASALPEEIVAFLAEHPGAPPARRLQQRWLEALVRHGRDETLIRYSPVPAPTVALECHRRRALLRAGREAAAFSDIGSVWLAPRSLPTACDSLLEAALGRGEITADMAWERLRLALDARQPELASYLIRFLAPDQAAVARLWLELLARPDRLVEHAHLAGFERGRVVYEHVFGRLLARDGDRAEQALRRLPDGSTPPHWRRDLQARLLVMAAARREPGAARRLAAFDDDPARHRDVREWRIRAALLAQDWEAVEQAIARLPGPEQEAPRWMYWHARALEATDRKAEAAQIRHRLAAVRDYHGFLAADLVGAPYRFGHAPLALDAESVERLEAQPAMARARELFTLGRESAARREWHLATAGLNANDRLAAAQLAHRWGWHDRAILAIAHTAERDDLNLRFPLAFMPEITAAAEAQGLDPSLALGVIRQESAFSPDARSPAGALGLMQLLPATARRVAANLGHPIPGRQHLLTPETNLVLGAAYLRRLIDRFRHHAVALAAYNAGPKRVTRWLPKGQPVPGDVWVETIPFRETRGYVQNVLFFSAIYGHRLEAPGQRLMARIGSAVSEPHTRLTYVEPMPPDG